MDRLRVGYTCNLRDASRHAGERYDEWESPRAVEAVVAALADAGCDVSVIDVGPDIYHVLERRRAELDLVFNNAEGLEEGELREAIVPFCCEQLGIPHTGSSPKTFINTLDKATAKRLVAWEGVGTPRFQVVRHPDDPLAAELAFPLMVKPDREGTSIGITQASRVQDARALRRQVERILDTYHQPALVEEFIDGIEYTIGLVGSYVLPILEVDLSRVPGRPDVRDARVKEIDTAFSDVPVVRYRTGPLPRLRGGRGASPRRRRGARLQPDGLPGSRRAAVLPRGQSDPRAGSRHVGLAGDGAPRGPLAWGADRAHPARDGPSVCRSLRPRPALRPGGCAPG
jgi:hypothetical protein